MPDASERTGTGQPPAHRPIRLSLTTDTLTPRRPFATFWPVLQFLVLASPHILPRTRVEEIMDRPDLPPDQHRQALAGLRTINRISLVARSLLRHVLPLARALGRTELHVLDVACGGGDVPIALARLARKRGVTLHLTLADQSPVALEFASTAAAALAIPHTTLVADALHTPLPQADVVTNSLFLHHLDPPEVAVALARFSAAARHLLLVSDLHRSRLHLVLAALSCYAFSRSRIVHHDGPASVRAAFTAAELLDFAHQAGLTTATIQPVWPSRALLTWRREGQ